MNQNLNLVELADNLRSQGKLAEFMESLGLVSGLFNCSTTIMVESPHGNIYRRSMHASKKGTAVEGDTHNWDHSTYIIRGKFLVHVVERKGDTPRETFIEAPACFLVRANCYHKFIALEDDCIIECVYSLRKHETGELTKSWDGDMRPYV